MESVQIRCTQLPRQVWLESAPRLNDISSYERLITASNGNVTSQMRLGSEAESGTVQSSRRSHEDTGNGQPDETHQGIFIFR